MYVFATHVNHALHTVTRSHRCCRHAVLACARLGDDPRLTHALGQQGLTDTVIDLMRAGMVEIFPFEPNLGAT